MNTIERYNELYELMASSGDPQKMNIFGKAEKWAFEQMVRNNPSMAEHWLERLEPVDWNNYLSEAEAKDITSKFVNQDGSQGAFWTFSQVDSAVREAGGDMECMPFYNGPALFAVMNMLVSDHHDSLRQFIPESDIPRAVYMMAVEKLKDKDRPEFVREYFDV